MRIETPSIIGSECLSVAEAKLHCRVDIDADDDWFTRNIKAARYWVENYIGGATLPQTITAYYDAAEVLAFDRSIKVPRAPALSITSITSYDDDDVGTLFSSSKYYRSGDRIALRSDYDWSFTNELREFDGLKIIMIAGYATLSGDTWTQIVPDDIKSAMSLIVAHWYENRGDDEKASALPKDIYYLLAPYRRLAI